MNNIYTIKIHSFVDLITNSSTEIYIMASEKTVEAIKQLVNSLIKLSKNNKFTCDDLFDITLSEVREGYGGNDRDVIVRAKKNHADAEIAAKILSNLCNLFNLSACYNG